MGLGYVLMAWVLIGLIAALAGSFVLPAIVELLTPEFSDIRSKIIRAARWFPAGCLVWAGAVFVFQGAANLSWRHRDVGIGDGFDCPLPNGYALSLIDVLDFGTVYDPKKNPNFGEVSTSAAAAVRNLQVAGPYILGSSGQSDQLQPHLLPAGHANREPHGFHGVSVAAKDRAPPEDSTRADSYWRHLFQIPMDLV
jgi:hypothetical protein